MRSLFRQVLLPFHSELREYATYVAFHTEKRPQVRVVACDHHSRRLCSQPSEVFSLNRFSWRKLNK